MNSASTGVLFRTGALSIFISTRSHVRHDACDFSISVEGGGKDKLLLNAAPNLILNRLSSEVAPRFLPLPMW